MSRGSSPNFPAKRGAKETQEGTPRWNPKTGGETPAFSHAAMVAFTVSVDSHPPFTIPFTLHQHFNLENWDVQPWTSMNLSMTQPPKPGHQKKSSMLGVQ